jgi:diphthine-ammonia ligase
VRFHGVEARVIQDQAKAIGIPLLQKKTGAETYEKEFKENIKPVLPFGVRGLVLGDIHLQDCLEWANKVCKSLALRPLNHYGG